MLRHKIFKLVIYIAFFSVFSSSLSSSILSASVLSPSVSNHDKIAQLFFIGITKNTPLTSLKQFLEKYPIGGIMLYGKPFYTPSELKSTINKLKTYTKTPLFIAVDQEGGKVQRIKFKKKYSNALNIGKRNDNYQSFLQGKEIGRELRQYGFNVNFAPVIDLYVENNPVIGNRSFSSKALTVSKMGISFSKGLKSEGVLATFKHFPGHGRTLQDSHFNTATSLVDEYVLEKTDLKPFIEAIKSNAKLIMSAHVIYPALDRLNIATFSKKIMTSLLRNELKYTGVIISDDLTMKAAKNNTKRNVYSDGFDAGIDMLLTLAPLSTVEDEFNNLKTYISANKKNVSLLNEKYNRIKTLKEKL